MKAVRADLKAAAIPDVDGADKHVDLHALGKSFITAMVAHGVTQRAAQSLARHANPRLTAKTDAFDYPGPGGVAIRCVRRRHRHSDATKTTNTDAGSGTAAADSAGEAGGGGFRFRLLP